MIGALDPALAFAAGALTILSPCVLPLVPIVLGSAAQRNRWGPLALAGGLVVGFTGVGFVLAVFGAGLGLDADLVRAAGAVALLAAGLVLTFRAIQEQLERALAPLADWASARQARLERFGLAGEAGIGLLMGLVWSPCVGPTLGAATVLAAQGRELAAVGATMLAFGCGIAVVLLAIGLVARGVLARWRPRMMAAGDRGKRALGALVVLVGLFILTGADRTVETLVLEHAPPWLTTLTTAF